MRVILLDRIQKLGNLGDTAEVRPGYARNYLFPQGKAVPETEENRAQVEAQRGQLEQREAERHAAAQALLQQLEAVETLTVEVKVNEERKLYGSVGPTEVIAALADVGVTAQETQVELADGPIRELGEHEIHLRIAGEEPVELKLAVLPA